MEEKKMSFFDLLTQGIGLIIGGGIFTSLWVAMGLTGKSISLVMVVAVIFGVLLTYPQMIVPSFAPSRGGFFTAGMMVLPRRLGGTYGLITLFSYLQISGMGISMATYVIQLIPGLQAYQKWLALGILTLFFLFGALGIDWLAKIQNVMVVLLLIAIGVYIFAGLPNIQADYFSSEGFFINGYAGFSSALPLMVMSVFGAQNLVNYAGVSKNPKRDIPMAALASLVVVCVVYVLMSVVASGVAPIEELLGQNLAVSAEKFMLRPLYIFFVIGGALFALGSTINGTLGFLPYPFAEAAEAGLLPKIITKQTKRGFYYILMAVAYVIGAVFPLLLNIPIESLLATFSIPGYISIFLMIVSLYRVPKLYKSAWESSPIHIPNSLYYVVITVASIAALYMIYVLVDMMGGVWVSLVALAIVYLYVTLLDKAGRLNFERYDKLKQEYMEKKC